MANTYDGSIDTTIGSDAEYQAWIQTFEAAFLASGFLEVAPDTGQINPLTVVKPASNTWSGYRMYRAKDALAASKPVYVKVEFGTSGNSTTAISIRRQVGTGSNGAGTLTGQVNSLQTLHPNAMVGPGTIWGGGGPSAAFVLLLDPGGVSGNFFYGVGRMRDSADGSASPEVLWDIWQSGSGFVIGNSMVWTDGSSAWASISLGLASMGPDLGQGIHSGGSVSVSKLFPSMVYKAGKLLVMPMVYGKAAELSYTTVADSKFMLNVWGGNHTFLPLTPSGVTSGVSRTCWLWE